MHQPTQAPPYALEQITGTDQPDLPAPDADEDAMLAPVAELGIDVRVWR